MSLHTALISGPSGTGKSASLRNLKNPEGVLFLNCEAGKSLPFPAKFFKGPSGSVGFNITDPLQIPEAFAFAETNKDIHTIVIDSLTYMMDMFTSVHIIGAADTMAGWMQYGEFFRNLMQQHVTKSTKNVFFTAHSSSVLNEADMVLEVCVKVSGSLMKNGIESFFNNVMATKKLPLKALEGYESPLLNITEEEQLLGFKYVYQTRITKATVNERIRAGMGMWSIAETFIDNDVQLVIDRMNEYYA